MAHEGICRLLSLYSSSILLPLFTLLLLTFSVGGIGATTELEDMNRQIRVQLQQLTRTVNEDTIDKYFGIDYNYQENLFKAKVNFLGLKENLEGTIEEVNDGPGQVLITLFNETRRKRMFFELIFQPGTVEKALHQMKLLLKNMVAVNSARARKQLEADRRVNTGYFDSLKLTFATKFYQVEGVINQQAPTWDKYEPLNCNLWFPYVIYGGNICVYISNLKLALERGANRYANIMEKKKEGGEPWVPVEVKEDLEHYAKWFWMQKVAEAGIDLSAKIKAHREGKVPHASGSQMPEELRQSAQAVQRVLFIWLGRQPINVEMAKELAAGEVQNLDKLKSEFGMINPSAIEWHLLVQVGQLLYFDGGSLIDKEVEIMEMNANQLQPGEQAPHLSRIADGKVKQE